MNITTVNLSDGQLKELRALGVENVSELMRQLVQSHIKKLRSGNKAYAKKRETALARLEMVRVEWWRVELARAKVRGDAETVKYYQKLLSEVKV